MSGAIKTAGQLRGFLAEVLVDLREKRLTPDEAGAIAKVAGEITRSLAVEVQTALHAGVANPVPGSMVIASEPGHVRDAPEMVQAPPVVERIAPVEAVQPVQKVHELPVVPIATDPPTNITENITPPPTKSDPAVALARSLDDATANFRRNQQAGEKIWCDQCDQRVTTSQAVACKSRHCKAKEAA